MATIDQMENRKAALRERHERVCSDYMALKEQYPSASASSLFETMANRYYKINAEAKANILPFTSSGIKIILESNGLYTPRKKSKI